MTEKQTNIVEFEIISRQRDSLVKHLLQAKALLDKIPKPIMWVEADCEDSSEDVWENNFEEIADKIAEVKKVLDTDYLNNFLGL